MKCLLVWLVDETPEDGWHICDPDEIEDFLDEQDFNRDPDLAWRWDEL